MSARDEQALDAYRRYRVEAQAAYYERQARTFQKALRRTTRISAVLLVGAAFFGALGTADPSHRGIWAFTATALAALATAVATYEITFGFERLSRQYDDTLAALVLADAAGLTLDDDGDALAARVTSIEQVLTGEVAGWSHLESDAPTRGER